MREATGRKPQATHQPAKVEREEVIVIDSKSDEIAAAGLDDGAHRRAPGKQDG